MNSKIGVRANVVVFAKKETPVFRVLSETNYPEAQLLESFKRQHQNAEINVFNLTRRPVVAARGNPDAAW